MINLNDYVDKFNTSDFIDEAKKPWEEEQKPGQPPKKKAKGMWAIDEPADDEAAEEEKLDKETMSKNMKRLLMKFQSWEPFFIVGEAGWGKTTIIKQMAKRFKLKVITVYLDKIMASDLGGIPVPVKGRKENEVEQELAMPPWAVYMKNHPDDDFLLFFDEMNQATPDVMNALMPIVLETTICNYKFDNFFVGAAGNFEHENEGGVNELSGPLKSRFKPIIYWESGGEQWGDAFKFLHKNWDDKVGKELVDKFEEVSSLFQNPREVEHKLLQLLYRLKKRGEYDYFDADDYYDRLEGLVKDDTLNNRMNKTKITELADYIYSWMKGTSTKSGEEKKSGRKRGKDISMVPKNVINAIKTAMKNGYLSQEENGKQVKYGISKENIDVLMDLYNEEDPDAGLNKEIFERIISKFETDGIKFRFEKDAQWKKEGYKDPLED